MNENTALTTRRSDPFQHLADSDDFGSVRLGPLVLSGCSVLEFAYQDEDGGWMLETQLDAEVSYRGVGLGKVHKDLVESEDLLRAFGPEYNFRRHETEAGLARFWVRELMGVVSNTGRIGSRMKELDAAAELDAND